MPYLEIVELTHQYSNRGALVCMLEEALGVLTCGAGCQTVTASSGTAALQAAILATAGRAPPDRPLALIPGYTFVATAMAAEACGYIPVFVDIEPDTWSLSPANLDQHPDFARCGVVLPVAPYGRMPSQVTWAAWQARTGCPVVIDAAAAFEAVCASPETTTGAIPVALSFQATKSFSTGEGGAVIWSDSDGLMRVAQALNFGFLHSRASRSAGFNGKMSEYHAAVGLASLEMWHPHAQAMHDVAMAYQRAAAAMGLAEQIVTAPQIASNYALFAARTPTQARSVAAALDRAGIEHRFWYGQGVHREPYFDGPASPRLPHVEAVAARLLGLPMFEDLRQADVTRIVQTIASALRGHSA